MGAPTLNAEAQKRRSAEAQKRRSAEAQKRRSAEAQKMAAPCSHAASWNASTTANNAALGICTGSAASVKRANRPAAAWLVAGIQYRLHGLGGQTPAEFCDQHHQHACR
ncbi:hypothetical protein [Xanthomonas vasicola]|uniref:hypothetical protein n=1 Tax=Xanthomonas vasicola TaxID=56459 RepID=UPI000DE278CB|nr:hypothetical protein KWO_001845 [Xanthomonas vasicola pv. musacearum NCPPB 4379]RJN12690.1 hypothetical protein DEG00_003550 [Xanthomonas vasicola]RJN30450.1 hypothetical protein DEF94_002015 [Xanthomonas vasicola]